MEIIVKKEPITFQIFLFLSGQNKKLKSLALSSIERQKNPERMSRNGIFSIPDETTTLEYS
jgi:hypothetical protein